MEKLSAHEMNYVDAKMKRFDRDLLIDFHFFGSPVRTLFVLLILVTTS